MYAHLPSVLNTGQVQELLDNAMICIEERLAKKQTILASLFRTLPRFIWGSASISSKQQKPKKTLYWCNTLTTELYRLLFISVVFTGGYTEYEAQNLRCDPPTVIATPSQQTLSTRGGADRKRATCQLSRACRSRFIIVDIFTEISVFCSRFDVLAFVRIVETRNSNCYGDCHSVRRTKQQKSPRGW